MKRVVTILAICLGCATAKAQTDSLNALSIPPIEKLQSAIVVDTIPTADSRLSIVLFNDNSWRYIRNEEIKADSTAFTNHWDTEVISPYRDVALSSIPSATAIELVDSLRSYHYPIKGRITSRYGVRHKSNHNGIDIALKVGDTICSTFNGVVRFAKATDTGYGTLVVVRHDNGIETYHAHLSKRLVEAGDRVVAGQPIALGGSSGRSTGPHLHFECRYMGQSFDPERLINFQTGNLRRDHLLMKRSYFSIYSKYEQDWNGEKVMSESEKKETEKSAERRYYKVRSGDYLGKIAQRNHTTVAAICRLNGIKPNTVLQIGRTLRVK